MLPGMARLWRPGGWALLGGSLVLALAACGAGGSPLAARITGPERGTLTGADQAGATELLQWPEFGLNPQRSDATNSPTGITEANVTHLRTRTVTLPGAVDSAPIYIHGATVEGATHDVIVVTTAYGRTLAIDANSGQILWTFTPPGYGNWAGSPELTNSTPIADPDHQYVYAASPNGLIYKLSLADGSEVHSGAWPARVTLEPAREKIGSPLNIDGSYLIAVTEGYDGDAPPYQGHVVQIDRETGQVSAVFNSLCANRRELIVPSTCPASDGGIWARGSALVLPGGKQIIVGTGNAPWNGTTDFGDSELELSVPGLSLVQAFTPESQEEDNNDDIDFGTGGPALLDSGEVLVGGKDGYLRVLSLAHMDGHAPSSHHVLGGELQRLRDPGGGEFTTEAAVWHHGSQTAVFVAELGGTAAYALRQGRLHELWENGTPGTSPVLAGGLLYVYNPQAGGVEVYRPSSPHPLTTLSSPPGHWNSPIVVDGHVIETTGNADEHLFAELTGKLEIYSAP